MKSIRDTSGNAWRWLLRILPTTGLIKGLDELASPYSRQLTYWMSWDA